MAKQATKTAADEAPRQDVKAPDRQALTPAIVKDARAQLENLKAEFAPMLPAHIPVDRFARVVMNAMSREPKLYACDRRTLWNACMQSAEDGLLPDGREGAIVPFGNRKANRLEAVWIPMVGGIRKKVRNSGLLSDFNVQAVHEGDAFTFELGESPFIRHAPAPGPRTRKVVWVYSIATFKDGTRSREVVHIEAIMQVARKSRAFEGGPWSDPVFFVEMCKKTVTKLHAKQLPSDRDLDRVLRRDDALYDFEDRKKAEHERPTIAGGTRGALDHFAKSTAEGERRDDPPSDYGAGKDHPADDGAGERQDGRQDAGGAKTAEGTAGDAERTTDRQDAGNHGSKAIAENVDNEITILPKPTTPAAYGPYLAQWLAQATTAAGIKARYKAEQELRLSFRDPEPSKEDVTGWLKLKDDRLAELAGGA